MLTPKYPAPDTASIARGQGVSPAHELVTVTPALPSQTPTPAPTARPSVQLTPGTLVAAVGGGTAVVLVVGTVLVSMLLAVAITAVSVTVCALVIRSLLNSHQTGR
ncbi:SpdD protein [Streptomyces lydicus]|uniref:SpdD protein n=1 Tax=Streptomyces lydicus TaxID=47763 RepID=UPI003793D2DC